jgi:hypothetical protein
MSSNTVLYVVVGRNIAPTQVEWGPPEMRGRTEDLLEGGEEGEDPRDAAGPASRPVREAQWGYGAG